MADILPDIYFFNPTCEMAVGNSHISWQPNRLLQKMEEDLGALPLFIARPIDVVLVKKLPPPEYLHHLRKIGITPPGFFSLDNLSTDKQFLTAPKNRLQPWGWSPAVHKLLEPLKPLCSESFRLSPVAGWKAEYREIYSRKFALSILKQVLPLFPEEKVIPNEFVPEICTSRQQAEELLERWGKLMVKAPWSSSGRGLQPVTKLPVVAKVWEKLLGIMNEQGYAIAEPYLEKVLDMALQFSLFDGKVKFAGISRFFTDAKGQYQGNYLNGWPETVLRDAAEFAETMIESLVKYLGETIENSLLARFYEGNFGIDTLIFRDRNGRLRINPCLEINVRQNMGLLSLQLEKLLVPGTRAVFKLFYEKEKSFGVFQKEMLEKHPAKFIGSLLYSGFYALTPATENTFFGSYILAD